MINKNILDMVGNTPVVELNLPLGDQIKGYIKLEGYNPTGSVKDRIAIALILDKIEKGELRPGRAILGSSGGSFACSLAFFGKVLGFPVAVVTGDKMKEDTAKFIEYFGAERIPHGNRTIEANRYCSEVIVPQNPEKYCFLDQFHDWENVNAHYRTTGPEILNDLPDVAAIAFSLGTGGSLYGITKYVKEKKPDTKIIAVTGASGSNMPGTYAYVDGEYVTPFVEDFRKAQLIDYTATVSEEQAGEKVKELNKLGFYVGIQTGGVLQGFIEGINELKVRGKVLMLSGDAGWKDMERLKKIL